MQTPHKLQTPPQILSGYISHDGRNGLNDGWLAVLAFGPDLLNSCSVRAPRTLYLIFIHSFIHFGHFYSAPSSPLPLRGAPDYSTDTVSEFHAEVHRQL